MWQVCVCWTETEDLQVVNQNINIDKWWTLKDIPGFIASPCWYFNLFFNLNSVEAKFGIFHFRSWTSKQISRLNETQSRVIWVETDDGFELLSHVVASSPCCALSLFLNPWLLFKFIFGTKINLQQRSVRVVFFFSYSCIIAILSMRC